MIKPTIFSVRRSSTLVATIMLAVMGVSFRRSGTVAVTAFATFGVARNLFSRTVSRTFQNHRSAISFLPKSAGRLSERSKTILARQSTTAAAATTTIATKKPLDLEQAYSTTHPAYEVLNKDVVTEYGAYCTLYRHKKSGAELLSVSVDDDNKGACVSVVELLLLNAGWGSYFLRRRVACCVRLSLCFK